MKKSHGKLTEHYIITVSHRQNALPMVEVSLEVASVNVAITTDQHACARDMEDVEVCCWGLRC